MPEKALKIDNFMISADQLSETEGEIFPSVLSMDLALGGGIPGGSTVLIAGKQKSGKTTFALTFVRDVLQNNEDIVAYFFDVESRLRTDLLRCIPGLQDNPRFKIIRSNTTKILSGEDFLNFIIQQLKDNPRCICILDSIAALLPAAEMASLIGDSGRRASTASMMYQVLRSIAQVVGVNQNIFIALTHLISNPSGYGKSTSIVGGNAMQYQASTILEVSKVEAITDSNNSRIGQLSHFTVAASSLRGPGEIAKLPIIYGTGIDRVRDTIIIALELNIITRAGKYYEIDPTGLIPELELSDKDRKHCGEVRLLKFVNKNPEVPKLLEEYIRNIMLKGKVESYNA